MKGGGGGDSRSFVLLCGNFLLLVSKSLVDRNGDSDLILVDSRSVCS